MQALAVAQKRRIPRESVTWDAQAQVGDLVIQGTVRDWSVYGLFFEPDLATDGGRFYEGPEILDEMGKGLVTVKVHGLILDTKIRWTGRSDCHGCYGFGSEFQRVSCQY